MDALYPFGINMQKENYSCWEERAKFEIVPGA